MSGFIASIGNARLNGYGADLYENADSTASIRFDRNTKNLPRKTWLKFNDVESAESYIESNRGESGACTLNNVLASAGIFN